MRMFTSFFLSQWQYAAIGFLPPKCKMWRLRIIVCLFVCLTKMQGADVANDCLFDLCLTSLGFYFPKMQDVDVAMIVCWFVGSVCLFDQDARNGFCNNCLSDQYTGILVGSFLPSSQDTRCRCCNDARGESFMAGIPTSNILDLEWLRFQASFLFTNFSLRSQLVQPENDLNLDILMCNLFFGS